jgi:hypothetical protein
VSGAAPGGAGSDVSVLRGLLGATAPPEPEAVRVELHTLACDDPAGAPPVVARALETELWAAWSAVLEPLGVARPALGAVVAGARRETWLWVMGERTWSHTVEGLAGRAARRLAGT